jgi:TIGR00266 family protein
MVEYNIKGNEVQYLDVKLNQGESIFVEPGHLIYRTPGANIETKSGGLRGAFSHMLSGSAVFLMKVDGPGSIGSAGFLPGKILRIDLTGNSILAEFNAFLCMDSSITYSSKFAGIWQGMVGGEGMFLEKFTGTGALMLHGHGHVISMDLAPGEEIQAEMSHVLAFEETVQYNVSRIGGIKTMLLAGMEGEGLYFASMRGPGKVWLHTISLQELAAKMMTKG